MYYDEADVSILIRWLVLVMNNDIVLHSIR